MSAGTPHPRSSLLTRYAVLLALSSAFACAGPEPRPAAPSGPQEPSPAPPEPGSTDDDWILLSSGEWLRGEIQALDDDHIEFESEELDTLELDWPDVVEIRTKREFTVLLTDSRNVTGVLTVDGAKVSLSGESGTTEITRDEVHRIVPGAPKEANYWSGEVGLSLASRSGNTDQTDLAYSVALMRETAASRLPISFAASYSEVDDDETENNKRFNTRYDRFLGPRLFVTLLGVEVVQDRFQNIDRRITPFSAVGYTVVDRSEWSVDVTGGFGYRFTRFRSVPDGEDRDDSNAIVVLGSTLESDLTKRIEFEAGYTAHISTEDTADTIQKLELSLSVDVWREFEIDVTFTWDHVGKPEEDSDGDTPDQDDYRLLVGLVWTF